MIIIDNLINKIQIILKWKVWCMKNYQVYFQIMNQNYCQIKIKEIFINKTKNNNNY